MAELIEPLEEAEETTEQATTEAVEEAPAPEPLPEKYRDKSLEDVVRMHQEAEQMIGRQSQEVGELRGVVDSYIKRQIDTPAPQATEDEDVDFFTDPEKAVGKAIANHPKVKEAETLTTTMRAQLAKQTLDNQHPDAANILQDPEFQNWIRGSAVNQRLFQQAHSEYDTEAADYLLSSWKEKKQIAANTASAETQVRKQSVRQASTGTAKASGQSAGRKVYRRTDIMKLMKEDPARYEAMQPEIMAAYAEGRVK